MDDLRRRLQTKTFNNPVSGCWDWTAAKDQHRYGRVSVRGRMQLAHRASFEAHVGHIPAGQHVLHRCDNPSCINPAHLFLGDQAANMADKAAKGRVVSPLKRGEDNGFARLTEADVIAIRAAKGLSQRKLAKRFGVSQLHISRIQRRIAWGHVQ